MGPFLLVTAATVVTGCGGPGGTSTLTAPTAGPVSPTPNLASESATSTTAAPAAYSYESVAFSVPLTVVVEPVLQPGPTIDAPGLLYWDAVGTLDKKVRFLVPAEVYAPGSTSPQAPPADYLPYLQGQAAQGVSFSSVSTTMVDGRSGTLLTGTTTTDLDGSIGCPEIGGDPADDCFGFQSDVRIRIVVIDLGSGRTLLAWARMPVDGPDDGFAASFERMLASLRFR